MPWVEEWPSQGACRGEDPDALFVQGAAQQQAKQVCRACPVRSECLAHALDTRTEFGVWGGMTERERRQWLRDHPEVTSWRGLLERAKGAHEHVGPGGTVGSAGPVTSVGPVGSGRAGGSVVAAPRRHSHDSHDSSVGHGRA